MIARQLLFLFSALGAINGIFLAVYFFSRPPRCLATASSLLRFSWTLDRL